MLKKMFAWSSLMMGLLILSGCGQTGPLYLPRPQAAHMATHAPSPAKNQDHTQ